MSSATYELLGVRHSTPPRMKSSGLHSSVAETPADVISATHI